MVEDDLLFAPDFMEYFRAVAPVLEEDGSLFVVSAWNDNGFRDVVADTMALRRTEYFPGLGWLLPRKLFFDEVRTNGPAIPWARTHSLPLSLPSLAQLLQAWPRTHWDHWLRSEKRHRGRECVHPEVPRTFHNGEKGTFMDHKTHEKYFARIAMNQDASVQWPDPDAEGAAALRRTVHKAAYEERLQQLIRGCRSARSVEVRGDEVTAVSPCRLTRPRRWGRDHRR